MHPRTLLAVPLLLALATGLWCVLPRAARAARASTASADTAAPAPTATPVAAPAAVPATPAEPKLPPALFRKLAPGETVALTLPDGLTDGVRCPDGSYLPLLNGVPYAGAISRARAAGPLPPVVAKTADQHGVEWYVHADGSRTTTQWATIDVEGQPRREVLTQHVAPLPEDLERSSADDLVPAPTPAAGHAR